MGVSAPQSVAVPAAAMKIGELARRSGLPIKTLRFYEDRGLLPAAGRSSGGYRLFSISSLQRLAFIRRLKALGLSLEEIAECLGAHDAGRLPCSEVQRLLEQQIERVDHRMEELRLLRGELQQLLADWRSETGTVPDVIALKFTEPSLGPAGRAIEIRLSGRDLKSLKTASEELQAWLSRYQGELENLDPGVAEDYQGIDAETATQDIVMNQLADSLRFGLGFGIDIMVGLRFP